MARYHINPTTGEPGPCRAEKKCRFGGSTVHYPSAANARAAYELSMGPAAFAAKAAQAQAEKDYAPDDAAYDEILSHGREALPNFQSILTTLTRDDIAHGVKAAAIQASNNNPKVYGFEALMGKGKRRTEKAEELYDRKIAGIVSKDPNLRGLAFEAAEAKAKREVWGRAFERNVAIDPVVEQEFKAMWNGAKGGLSHQRALEQAQEAQDMFMDLREGKISPTSVVGSGLRNPAKAAREYLDERIISLGRALATEGRSEALNVGNAIHRARQAGLHPKTPGF